MPVFNKELSQNIDIETREFVEPYVDLMMSKIKDEIELANQKQNVIKKNTDEVLNQAHEMICKLFTGEEERHLVESGLDLIYDTAKHSSEGKLLLEDFRQAGMRIKERFVNKSVAQEEIKVFETIQESFGVSNQSVETIYKIGYDFFVSREIEKALAVFSFLTFFNNCIFESWLMLGVIYKEFGDFCQALYAFSMASLVDLHHPLPHLYSAEMYYMNGNNELAQQTLDYGLSIFSNEDMQTYKKEIEDIGNLINM